jgi:hypothetical protein
VVFLLYGIVLLQPTLRIWRRGAEMPHVNKHISVRHNALLFFLLNTS